MAKGASAEEYPGDSPSLRQWVEFPGVRKASSKFPGSFPPHLLPSSNVACLTPTNDPWLT